MHYFKCSYGVTVGVAASQDQDFGTAKLHVEVSDVVSVLVYVGIAKGNGVLSKTGKTGETCGLTGAVSILYLNRWLRETFCQRVKMKKTKHELICGLFTVLCHKLTVSLDF